MMAIDAAEVRRRFTHHPPDAGREVAHEEARRRFTELAEEVVRTTPTSREQSLAITALEEALFWTNAAIARPERAT